MVMALFGNMSNSVRQCDKTHERATVKLCRIVASYVALSPVLSYIVLSHCRDCDIDHHAQLSVPHGFTGNKASQNTPQVADTYTYDKRYKNYDY